MVRKATTVKISGYFYKNNQKYINIRFFSFYELKYKNLKYTIKTEPTHLNSIMKGCLK